MFLPSPEFPTPSLCNHGQNTIIIFRGHFNPPHQGHLEALANAFYHSPHDMNVIATIIIPDSDAKTFQGVQAQELRLRFGQRCELWNREMHIRAWTWVFPRDLDNTNWGTFETRLVTDIRNAGYKINFAVLQGSEHMRAGTAPVTPTYTLNTNASIFYGRKGHTAIKTHESGLRGLGNHTPWNTRSWSRRTALTPAANREILRMVFPEIDDELLRMKPTIRLGFEHCSADKECKERRKPWNRCVFIPLRPNYRTKSELQSSDIRTKIRHPVGRTSVNNLADYLASDTIGTGLLIQYLYDGRYWP
jgi:hypothetical protein